MPKQLVFKRLDQFARRLKSLVRRFDFGQGVVSGDLQTGFSHLDVRFCTCDLRLVVIPKLQRNADAEEDRVVATHTLVSRKRADVWLSPAAFKRQALRGGMDFGNLETGQQRATSSLNEGRRYVPNPFFGQILQARSPREIQFGLKFIF